MVREASEATLVRNYKAQVKRINAELDQVKQECTIYRGRAGKAEAEAAEWKRRFDILLSREPSPPASGNQP